jgi:protein gp37
MKGFAPHWLIAGSESGRGARPCNVDWVRSLRDECIQAGTAFFWKQHIENGRKLSTPELDGRRWREFPQVERAA